MNPNTLIALAIAAAFAAPVAAQTSSGADKAAAMPKSEAGATAAGGFAGMDKNNDGYLSRDEAKDAAWSNRFSELDKDNDGRVSQSEFDALGGTATGAAGATGSKDSTSPSTTGGIGAKPGQKQ